MQEFDSLRQIVEKLRDPIEGCPWDVKQTPQSLIPNFIEELYETIEAIDNNDSEHLKEELGDLLLHILMQAQIAHERGEFTLADVLKTITVKLVSRHPHVFDKIKGKEKIGAQQVKNNWERLKHHEKRETRKSILEGIPKNMPALIYAQRMQEKAASVGFDWNEPQEVLDKIEEEIRELRAAEKEQDPKRIKEEIGDLLFAVVNYARKVEVDSEAALKEASAKFRKRFQKIEDYHRNNNENIYDSSMEKLDDLWEASKKDI
ncbi:MAG: nucleoside triphosphate pyrophosphohydrolase [Candidatus Cloacimonetes bacterium]|nr:nucleoside triphosphate pyrophosphohydrolase [Candidatus Cloacimonadota bacterium]